MGVPAQRAVGLSGYAPCRLCRHGHSASIHSRLRAYGAARSACHKGPKPGAPPRWARRKGLRPGLLRQVVQMRAGLDAGHRRPPRHERRLMLKYRQRRPAFMELPRQTSIASLQMAAGAFPRAVEDMALARVRAQAGEAVTRGCRVGQSPFGKFVPRRPWLVVNPGRGMAAPRASWRQPCGENNFPCAARIPRGTNSFRLQVLHCVAAAARCRQPVPRLTDHNKDAMGATLPTRKENHHG